MSPPAATPASIPATPPPRIRAPRLGSRPAPAAVPGGQALGPSAPHLAGPAIFRRAFLALLPDEDLGWVARLGELLEEAVWAEVARRKTGAPGHLVRRDLLAACGELRLLVGDLEVVAEVPKAEELKPRAQALCRKARQWQQRIQRLAAEIEAALEEAAPTQAPPSPGSARGA